MDDATRFYANKLDGLRTLKDMLEDAAFLVDNLMSAERAAPVADEELVSYLSVQLDQLESFADALNAEVSAVLPLASGT